MPLSAANIKKAEELEERLRSGLENAADPDYEENSGAYNKLSRAIDDYYTSQRKTDAAGKLTAPAATRSEPIVQGNPKSKESAYHFEPSVAEVRTLLKNSPELVKQYNLQRWMAPQAPYSGVTDPMSGAPVEQEPSTSIDTMTESSTPYRNIAEHLWRQKADQAKAAGVNLKRYRDVHFKKGQAEDFIKGGLEYNIDRRLAPAALGIADAYTMGAASPVYDALAERYNKFGPTRDTQSLADQEPTEPDRSEAPTPPIDLPFDYELPTSQGVKDRSPGIYHGTNMLAYGLPDNPTNAIQGLVADGLGYAEKNAAGQAARGVVGKALISGAAGGMANAAEGAVRDTAEGISQGKNWSDIAAEVGAGVPINTGFGAAGGIGGDLIAQGAGKFRENFRRQNPDIRTLYNSGGDTSLIHGTRPSPEVEAFVQEGVKPRPKGSPGALAADAVGPKIEQSLQAQDVANNRRIGEQVEGYFNHPAYRDIKVKGTRLVQALVDMAQQGSFRSPVTGTAANINPELVSSVNKELGASPWAQARYVPRDQSAALAHQHGGVVVDTETAQKMFGDDGEFHPPGYDAVIIPKDFTARELTGMEEKVDRILKMYSDGDAPANPVYEHLNRALKETRDEFPYWEDADGNLVAPPEVESRQEPFGRAEDIPPPEQPPQGGVSQYPRPVDIGGGEQVPSSRSGVGPGQPDLPPTFERREATPQQPDTPLEAMARPIDIMGPSDQAPRKPEGLMSVGPQDPSLYLPRNPFESLPGPTNSGILAESIQPKPRVDVQGSYNEPELIQPQHEAIPGVGPRRDQSQLSGASPDALYPNQSLDVTGGESFEPQRVYPDEPPPVETPRMPLGLPEEPRSLGADEYMALDERTPLSEMAGTSEAPMSIQPEELMSVQPAPSEGAEGYVREPTEPLRRPDKTPVDDSRSPLERQLDGELEQNVGPNQSLPTPDGKAWDEVRGESKQYTEDILAPGREARADDSQRMAERTNQQQTYEDASAQVRNMEERLGPLPDSARLKSVLGIMSTKLGREVTKEDLIKAGIISAGAAATFSDDEDTQNAGNAAMLVGGLFGGKHPTESPKKGPTQPEATLDDGRVVRGFSAIRRKQSESKKGLETAMKRVGVSNEKTLRDRLIEFRQGDNKGYDDALEAEAKKLGLSEELWRVPAAAGQLEMERNRALLGGSGKNLVGRIAGAGGPRLDRIAGLLAGAGRNPYSKGPDGLLEALLKAGVYDPTRNVLDLSAGRVGARYGDDLSRIYDALNQQFQSTQRKPGDDDKQEGQNR